MTAKKKRFDFNGFVHKYMIIRRIIIGVGLWMAIDAYLWAQEFAYRVIEISPDNAQWAGSLVQAMPTLLMGYIIKKYCENKYQDE